jgi:hypothetical protein
MWPVPWDPTPEQVARLATVLAGTLAESLARDLHDPIVRRRVSDLAAALRHNADDPAFNIAFYSSGGAAMAAGVARRLHDADGTHDHDPLSAESDAIVADFAYSVAATSAMVDDGRIQHGERLLDPIVHPAGGDFWSAGMLFAHGPKGTEYGKGFLAAAGRSVLDWRRQHPDGITYFDGTKVVSKYPVPSGYVGDKGSWYDHLGLRPDYLTQGADEQATTVGAVLANDPTRNILGVLGQNGGASTELLGGENGRRYAKDLLDPRWVIPHTGEKGDESAARVILAGTVPRVLGEGGLLRTQAAANVFQAADNAQRSGLDRLPADLTRALGGMARTYILDLARSTRTKYHLDDMPEAVGSSYIVQSDDPTVRGVLSLLYWSPEQWGALQGTAEAQFCAATAARFTKNDAADDFSNFARLLGAMSSTEAGHKRSLIEAQVAAQTRQATFVKVLVNGGTDVIAAVASGNPATLPIGLALTFAAPALIEALPSTPLPDLAPVDSIHEANLGRLQVPLVQGLIDAGKLPPPVGKPWFQNGVIQLESPEDIGGFAAWWGSRAARYTTHEEFARFVFVTEAK